LTAVLFVVVIIVFKLAVPQLQLGFVWRAALALPGMYLYLLLMTAIHFAFPPRVEVRGSRISVQHGEHAWFALAKSMTRARIMVFAPDRVRLRLWYRWKIWKREKIRTRTIGIASNANLDRLCQLLPTAPDVWDARERYRRLCERGNQAHTTVLR
jgi:hypothetical protein